MVNNRITLVGTLVNDPDIVIDPDGGASVYFELNVPPPPGAPPTYWGVLFDLRHPGWPTGEDTFLIIGRDARLIDQCLKNIRKGDLVYLEGRLVLTLLRTGDGELLPLAEILASEITPVSPDTAI